MTSNEKLCENLRHGIYFDGYDILSDKTNGIMKEGAARIKRQAAEIESLTAERDRLRSAMQASIKILDANLGRQEEKLYDIKPILLAAMRNGA